MQIFDWKIARWVIMLISAVTFLMLFGILEGIVGISLTEKLLGFEAKLWLAVAQGLIFYLAWKIL